MKWRSYLSEVFSRNRVGKLIVALFQLLFWWQYCNISTFNVHHNIFTTVPLASAGSLMGNLAWLLYYWGGEFYLLGTLQEKMLSANPLVVVRSEKRTIILLNCGLTIFAFAVIYNLVFLGFISVFAANKIQLLFLGQLFASLCLSLSAFTLLLLLFSLVQPLMGWIGGILVSFCALFFKTDKLTMLTNNVTGAAVLVNIVWIIILVVLVQQINSRLETK